MRQNYKLFKVLNILSYNSKTKSKEIGKEIGTSQQNASNFVNKLESNKIIKNYNLLVDSSKFGFVNFCVFLRIKKYSKSFINSFTSDVKKYKEITSIDFLFGNYDIFLRFTTPNPSYFNKILKNILNEYSENLQHYMILNQIVLYHFPSNYLSKKRYENKIVISGDRDIVQLDDMDRGIINLLNENSKTSFLDISKKLKTTPKTVIGRVKALERKNIIRGYSIVKDHQKIGIGRYYVFLRFNFFELENEKKFKKFVINCENIVEYIKVFGEWDALLIVEVKKIEDYKEILFLIKEQFFDFIEDYSFLESEQIKIWRYTSEI